MVRSATVICSVALDRQSALLGLVLNWHVTSESTVTIGAVKSRIAYHHGMV